ARLEEHAARSEREVLIASPYFVPGEDGMRLMDRARAHGARVAVLANSLAAADEPVVSSATPATGRRCSHTGSSLTS
ncbi:MAG TPA: hypothetical protein VFG47_10725, partial [Geminicoccaceae bacterium]|nr:hypothetical protein [Geminicoccaceae bacterium]